MHVTQRGTEVRVPSQFLNGLGRRPPHGQVRTERVPQHVQASGCPKPRPTLRRLQPCPELVARRRATILRSVVAEGIETYDEFRAVCDCGALYGQGYLFARPSFPMPPIAWPPQPSTGWRGIFHVNVNNYAF